MRIQALQVRVRLPKLQGQADMSFLQKDWIYKILLISRLSTVLRGTINPVPASGQEPCTTNIKGLIVFNFTNKYLSVILIITHIYMFTLEKNHYMWQNTYW